MNIDKIKAYLERIDYHGSLALTAQTLRDLQLAHLLAVPFENLSIHWGEPVVLEDDALYDKVIVRQRGGFCYELNGLFAWLLRSLGFDVAMLAAGVANDGGGYSPYFDSDDEAFVLMERKGGEEWKAVYRFNLQAYAYADYTGMCHYHQTSPESHFTQRRVCSRATSSGRLTLSETRFIITSLNGERQEQEVTNEKAYALLLDEHFGISAKG